MWGTSSLDGVTDIAPPGEPGGIWYKHGGTDRENENTERYSSLDMGWMLEEEVTKDADETPQERELDIEQQDDQAGSSCSR